MLQVELLMFPYFSRWVAGDGVVVGVLVDIKANGAGVGALAESGNKNAHG